MSNFSYRMPRSDFNNNCSCFNFMKEIIIIRTSVVMEIKEDAKPIEIIIG